MKLLSLLLMISIVGAVLVLLIAFTYSYNTMSALGSGAGFLILSAVAVFIWFYRRNSRQHRNASILSYANPVGMILGLLWIIESSINNILAPPLPARDIIDNVFWGIIAMTILALAIVTAFRTKSVVSGIEVGGWSGFVSGLLACCMALSVIVFGMHFITQDPLNIAEWSTRNIASAAPTMAAYFAFETFAGAFLHLVVLGVGMGIFLGLVGGLLGMGYKRVNLRRRKLA